MKQYDVIIIGGGYAGIMCALRLAAKLKGTAKKIALINPVGHFVERLRLHESLGVDHTKPLRSFDLDAMLASRGVVFIQGEVIAIDRLEWCLNIRGNDKALERVGYERLVIAVGSHTQKRAIPGLQENSYSLDAGVSMGASQLRNAARNTKAPKIVVVGAGATGVEIAAEMALVPAANVTLIDRGDFGGFVLPPVAKHIRKKLDQLGVGLLENTEVSHVRKKFLKTESGEISFDICVSATGFQIAPLVSEAELPMGANGRILCDGALRSVADDHIYAAGDAALPTHPCGAPARMSVLYALATGAYVASAIADDLAGKKLRRFGFWTYGQAIGLGKIGIGYNNMRFDRASRPYLTGRAAYHLRNFFIGVLFQLLKIEHRFPGLPFYLGQPFRRTIANGGNK